MLDWLACHLLFRMASFSNDYNSDEAASPPSPIPEKYTRNVEKHFSSMSETGMAAKSIAADKRVGPLMSTGYLPAETVFVNTGAVRTQISADKQTRSCRANPAVSPSAVAAPTSAPPPGSPSMARSAEADLAVGQ